LIRKDDLTGYANILADDMVYIAGDKIRRNKKSYLSAVELMMDVTKPADTISYKITDLRTASKETVVGVFQIFEMENPQRKSKMRSELATEETWVKTPTGWRVVGVTERNATMFKNGKKIYPK
jgi:hypothetical protein